MLLFLECDSQRCPVDARVSDDKQPHWVTMKAQTQGITSGVDGVSPLIGYTKRRDEILDWNDELTQM